MAKNQVISYKYTCDVSGIELDEAEVEHREFTVPDGKKIALDLCAEEAERLAMTLSDFEVASEMLAEFAKAGTVVKPTTARGTAKKATAAKSAAKTPAPRTRKPKAAASATNVVPIEKAKTGDVKVIREWAISQGYTVPKRGRLPQSILTAYEAVAAQA